MKARDDVRRALMSWICTRAFWKIRHRDLDAKGAIYDTIEAWRHARRPRSTWYERG